MLTPRRVVLVCMPMGLVQVPNLGLSLLKASLARAGIDCTVRYFSLELLRFLDPEEVVRRYVHFVNQPYLSYIGASRFTARRFGDDPTGRELAASRLTGATDGERRFVEELDQAVDPFLEHCLAAEDWSSVAVVGFTSIFAGMTIPSATLAWMLKARFPHLRTVLGGWNTNGEMGTVIAERLPELDFVLRGESEESFVALCRALLEGRPVGEVPGLVRREPATGELVSFPQRLVGRLDDLPYPDFSDWFETFAASGLPPGRILSLPFETSRGCWWGEKHPCIFCGLNGLSMPYRSKSPERAVAEIDHIVERHAPDLLFASDTILDLRYFREVLPRLHRRHRGLRFAYEVKGPLSREKVELLGEAGIDQITVGIESLSTHALAILDKGATYLQNIHTLRLAAEFGVAVGWQFLYRFPGERLRDYEAIASDVPLLTHLSPPERACTVTLARFSPLYDGARERGVERIRADPDYRICYPWPEADLDRVAYHFEYDLEDGRDPTVTDRIRDLLVDATVLWQEQNPSSRLESFRGDSLEVLVDTRGQRRAVFLLSGHVKRIHQALDEPSTLDQVTRSLAASPTSADDLLRRLLGRWSDRDRTVVLVAREACRQLAVELERIEDPFAGLEPEVDLPSESIEQVLERLVVTGLALHEDGRHLALAVPRSLDPWLERARAESQEAERTPVLESAPV